MANEGEQGQRRAKKDGTDGVKRYSGGTEVSTRAVRRRLVFIRSGSQSAGIGRRRDVRPITDVVWLRQPLPMPVVV